MLQVMPQASVTWPIPGDVPDLLTIITEQGDTIAANAALIDAYQANLNTAQNPPPGTAATGNGTTTGTSTSLVVVGSQGTIAKGATITSTATTLPTGVTVLGQISGTTGGDGTYLVSTALTLATAAALTFTPPPPASTWPGPAVTDAPTLQTITQQQTAILRNQNALLQHYTDLLTTSQTPAPPTGP